MVLRALVALVLLLLGVTRVEWSPGQAAEQMAQCSIVPQVLAALPDGKTYALVLGSIDAGPVDLEVSLYSAFDEYRVRLPSVSFDVPADRALTAPTRRRFQSAPQFVMLPKAAALLMVIVPPNSASAEAGCISFLYTDAYRRRSNANYRLPEFLAVERAKLFDNLGERQATLASAVGPNPFPCAAPFADIVTTRPVEPDYPPIAIRERATGTVQVKVTVDATGLVLAATIYKSSGNADLDRSALAAARASVYLPARVRCEPAGGSSLFRADFSSQ